MKVFCGVKYTILSFKGIFKKLLLRIVVIIIIMKSVSAKL